MKKISSTYNKIKFLIFVSLITTVSSCQYLGSKVNLKSNNMNNKESKQLEDGSNKKKQCNNVEIADIIEKAILAGDTKIVPVSKAELKKFVAFNYAGIQRMVDKQFKDNDYFTDKINIKKPGNPGGDSHNQDKTITNKHPYITTDENLNGHDFPLKNKSDKVLFLYYSVIT